MNCADFTHLLLTRSVPWQAQMLDYFEQIFRLAERQEQVYELKIKSKFLDAWILLAEHFEELHVADESAVLSASSKRLKQMISYVQDNYQEKISLSDIAQSANVSISECSRCFKKFLGATPIEYVMQIRIVAACKLFETTELKIPAVAEECGFIDYSYFHRVFKKYTGCTPKEYQKVVRQYEQC